MENWLQKMTPEERNAPRYTLFVDGAWQTMTAEQVMAQVRGGTQAGEDFVEKILGINLEMGMT